VLLGDVRILGTARPGNERDIFGLHPELSSVMEIVELDELPKDQVLAAVQLAAVRIEQQLGVVFAESTLPYALALAERTPGESGMPGKIIEILESAAAYFNASSIKFDGQAPTKSLPTVGPEQVERAIDELLGEQNLLEDSG